MICIRLFCFCGVFLLYLPLSSDDRCQLFFHIPDFCFTINGAISNFQCKVDKNNMHKPKWHHIKSINHFRTFDDVASIRYSLWWRHNERNSISNHQPVYATICSDADQRKHQSSTSLAFLRGIHQGPNSLHKWPVTWKMFPFDDVVMSVKKYCAEVWYLFL